MINGGIINTVAAAAEVCTTNNSSFPVANTAYYKLDGDAIDSAGTNNGTSTDVTWGVGRFGPAAVFNGSSSHIDFPSPIPYTNTDMTFSCWINLASSFSSSYKAIIGAGNKTGGEGRIRLLIRYMGTNSYRIEPIRAYSGNSYYTSATSYPAKTIYAGTWYNLVYTYSATGNTAKIYLNGSLVSTTNLTITSTDIDSGVLALGQYRDGASTTRWNGSIDQVRIFNTVITQAQVTELYQDEIECCTTDEVNYPVTNTAYYQLNGGTGTTVVDETGTYNGTTVNGVTYGTGKFNDAAVFDGTNDYINLGNGLTSGLTNSFTVSLWLKIDTSPSANTCAFSFQRTIWFDMFVPANNILNVRLLNSSVGSSAVSILNPLVNGTWNNVVFVADKTNSIVKLYLNNQLQGSASWNGTKYDRVEKNVIGSYGTGTVLFFPGSVDQVRIFPTAITAGQVAELYQEKLCGPAVVPSDNFNTVLYTGNGTAAGVANNIVGVGFQPDLVWVKNTGLAAHNGLFDVARGVGWILYSNLTNREAKATGYHLTSFNTDGFTMEGNSNVTNLNNNSYVSWSWKAGGATVLNEEGSIDSQVSANTDAGFSIVSYTGNGVAGATVGHGLSSAPEFIIAKNRDEVQSWIVNADAIGKSNILTLDNLNAMLSRPNQYYYDWNGATITMGNQVHINGLNDKIIAYCFHSVDGFSKFGSYPGTGANGNFILTGFRPAFVMVKRTNAPDNWTIVDNKRGLNVSLFADLNSYQLGNNGAVSFEENGFTVNGVSGGWNNGTSTYLYMAFAADN